ncbi:MAG TPA: hypothetical protein DD458_02460 [Prolixibacteraceae bacterium]|nr:hypothetical protein [Prolixibacteraceae bacterium]HCU61516.1 hypothetical protein [Prolixibacteraceae bacterium]
MGLSEHKLFKINFIKMGRFVIFLIAVVLNQNGLAQDAKLWEKHEISFVSSKEYNNPVYDVKNFKITFCSPSGREKTVRGFWDGGKDWKVRFLPDETGTWTWSTDCSDKENSGLHARKGAFECNPGRSNELIFQKGAIHHQPGKYYFSYNDGTPFFWLACTAWNGALKSTDEEWEYYLNHRKKNHYNVIQLVTTEWRGCDKNEEGLTAIDGSGYIRINPEFFKRIDKRIDEANAKGMVVSPVILWALPNGQGRHLSPGYSLPLDEAVLLAKYIVARYQGNHVVWTLGGDGKYYDDQEVKWKEIGRQVFNEIDHAPVTIHPHGLSWIGELFAQEDWYNMMGYQSSHSNGEKTVNWINRGPMAEKWSKLKPMPYINMEPNYEEIYFTITDEDVRNASYWSLFATPVAGITYGANGIWPWLAEGEKILNHSDKGKVTGWRKSLDFPGSIQMGYLAEFFNKLEWWRFFPASELLENQLGENQFNHWVSALKKDDNSVIVVYVPAKSGLQLLNPQKLNYEAEWFDPVENTYQKADIQLKDNKIKFVHDFEHDMLIILKRK